MKRIGEDLKGFVGAIVTTLLLALVVVAASLYSQRAQAGETKNIHGETVKIGDLIFVMVRISQPLLIDERVFEDHEYSAAIYSDNDSCTDRARNEMRKNSTEVGAGTAKYRVFAGCIAIPAPGKAPTVAPHQRTGPSQPPGMTL